MFPLSQIWVRYVFLAELIDEYYNTVDFKKIKRADHFPPIQKDDAITRISQQQKSSDIEVRQIKRCPKS